MKGPQLPLEGQVDTILHAGIVAKGTLNMPAIMVVEDNLSILNLVERFVARSSHEVLSSADGATALELLAKHVPDIVLLDLAMPGITGLDVLRYIRQENRLKDVKVVAMTAHADLVKEAAAEAKIDGVLMKPFSLRQLTDVIDRLVPLG